VLVRRPSELHAASRLVGERHDQRHAFTGATAVTFKWEGRKFSVQSDTAI